MSKKEGIKELVGKGNIEIKKREEEGLERLS
jgi:hypothetical protein